jgi:tRNA (guanine-N7-)-methyltransferase
MFRGFSVLDACSNLRRDMSRRNKLEKFAQLDTLPNVYQNYDAGQPILYAAHHHPVALTGRWAIDHFRNDHPITLELACGRGEYALALGRAYPERNFIGVDIKGARIWKGARAALDEQLTNVAFLRTRIEILPFFLGPAEVQEIWITFPDPFPRKGNANRRLTSPRFLEMYRRLLTTDGRVHLKTDDAGLFEYTLQVLEQTPFGHIEYVHDDIYAQSLPLPELAFKTYYERQHLAAGKTIKYVRFAMYSDPMPVGAA